MPFMTANYPIGLEQTFKTPRFPTALDSKSTTRKTVTDPQPFHAAESVPPSEILISTVTAGSFCADYFSTITGIGSHVSPALWLRYSPLPFVPA